MYTPTGRDPVATNREEAMEWEDVVMNATNQTGEPIKDAPKSGAAIEPTGMAVLHGDYRLGSTAPHTTHIINFNISTNAK